MLFVVFGTRYFFLCPLIILLALISIVCCAVALSACGGKKGGGNSSGNTQQTNPNGGTISGGDKDCEHQWGSWLTVSEATCTEKGKQERSCSVCGAKETKEIPALGHSFNTNNTCTRCGYELTPTVGLEYELITDKNSSYYAVTGLGNADAKEIVIPAYHAGKNSERKVAPVTSANAKAALTLGITKSAIVATVTT